MYERLDGREEGRAEARAESIRLLIQDSIEDKIAQDKTIKRLTERYQLSETEALAYIEQYKTS